MRFARSILAVVVAAASAASVGACSGAPDARRTDFLTDYSRLVHVDDSTARWIDTASGPFHTIILEPIEIRVPADHVDASQREELRAHTDKVFQKVATDAGYTLTDAPGAGVARVRVAITDVNKTAWWMQIHPVGNVSGSGAGGLSVEAEILDSMTNAQVAAVVRSFGRGAWLQLPSFSRLSDAKDAIDRWGEEATRRLIAWRTRSAQPAQ